MSPISTPGAEKRSEAQNELNFWANVIKYENDKWIIKLLWKLNFQP